MPRTWPEDWEARRAGKDCLKCAEGRLGEDPWGVRFFAGRWADAYLERRPPQPGTAVVIFRGGRHVADPSDFTDDELAGYWADVRTAAKPSSGRTSPASSTTPPSATPCRTPTPT